VQTLTENRPVSAENCLFQFAGCKQTAYCQHQHPGASAPGSPKQKQKQKQKPTSTNPPYSCKFGPRYNHFGGTEMGIASITIQVDEKAAKQLESISPESRRKVEILLGARILELTTPRKRSLEEIREELSSQAKANGLTEEILADLLKDE